jgi:uncharacterized protein (TIGR00255 family)
MVNSMTAFSTVSGAGSGMRWAWEIRGVNGRGLDIRTRLPEGCEALDQAVRAALGAVVSRGTITVGLKAKPELGQSVAVLNEAALGNAIQGALTAEAQASAAGLELAPMSAADLLSLKGVMDLPEQDPDTLAPWIQAAKADIATAVADFAAARAAEGNALRNILSAQIETVTSLTAEAQKAAEARGPKVAEILRANVARLVQNADGLDEARIAQELALLAVKSDVTEELDRLAAHAAAAEEMLRAKGPIGRKFDFLMQEFNREANTLCSKSGSTELTRIGLDLKTVIDQMREQVQNVE